MKLTQRFRLNSIRGKLSLLVILNGGFALLLVGLLLIGYEKVETRNTAKRELSSQAGIVADSSAAALTFLDERAAAETLKALRADGDIVQAATYTPDGRLFASYERGDPDSGRLPATLGGGGLSVGDGYLSITQPVKLGQQSVGTVYLKASLKEADRRLSRDMGYGSGALLVSLMLALLFSASMQRMITQPVAELARVARLVSVGKDYSARAVKQSDDEIGFLVDSFNDMLAQIEAREQALRESEERYALATRGSNDGVWDWKLETNEVYCSARCSQMLGYEEAETRTDGEYWFGMMHEADRDRVREEVKAHINGATNELTTEYRMRHKNGSFVWILSRGVAVRGADGKAIRMAGSRTDITQSKIADPLTGLPNRLYFLDRLESALANARLTTARIAVLFLGMDRFKLINDSMGHASGDALLERVSERLRARLAAAYASGDTAGRSVVARLGGDEFAILLDPASEVSKAAQFADTILKDLNAPYVVDGQQVFVGLSIGVALSSAGDTADELLRNADTAMYRAKTEGKSRFSVFDDRMRQQAVARLKLETELRNAIDNGEMLLHYQPQVAISSQRLTGFEALVRWMHPERGMIPPGEFIPVAEETGLIIPLGKWVLREACRQLVEWQNHFDLNPPLAVAVNVSFKQLVGKGFVEEVTGILAETGLAPDRLRLEMTESAVMKDPEESIETLLRLKKTGLELEIDDFGTGYSSLSYLSRLPFDTVKIDRSFVSELGIREDRREIVRTIVELAKSLHMDVIAEGVETETELAKLVELGCDRAQGYYFSKPLAVSAVPQIFRIEALKRAFSSLELSAQVGDTQTGKPAADTASADSSAQDLERLAAALGTSVKREWIPQEV